jgi:hypothetical protein
VLLAAFFVTCGAQAEPARVRCQTPSFCVLGWYDLQVSGRLTVTDPGGLREAIRIEGTFKKFRVDGEFTPERRAPGVRRSPPTLTISNEIGGAGTVTSAVELHTSACNFTKTYRHQGHVLLEGSVALGEQPTRAQLIRSGGTAVPGGFEVRGVAGGRDQEYDPRVAGLCVDDFSDYTIGDMMDSFGVGKCVDPAGADPTFDRNCLAIGPFEVRFTLQVIKRETLSRLAFPINRLWTGKSFVVSGQERQTFGDRVADIQVRVAMTRRR